MRNLKKVLALALATVMLLGMMAMASATDYTDAADINEKYAVAVDVMTAVGVFEGNPDGGFNPKGELTREAAAKIAVYVALTKDTAKYVTAVEAPFDDVAAERWSAGSIVAAKNLGLIDGNGDGTFAPTKDLTGYAFAKMMLGVLGYKSSEEGFTGSGWEFNVNMAAAKAGLLKGLDASKLANTMTREEAAQMAFNALKAQPVVYVGGSSVTINGITITTGAQKEAETYVNDEDEAVAYTSLAAKLYPKLSTGTKVDAYGYAYDTWKYDGTEIAAAKDFTVKATYADAAEMTLGALYAKIGKATADVAVKVYVNGADANADFTIKKDTYKDKTDVKFPGYKGASLELIVNDGKNVVMVANPEIAKVTKVTEADAAKETKRTIDVKTLAGVEYKGIETTEYAKDDLLKIFVKAGDTAKVIDTELVAAADAVYGTVTKIDVDKDGFNTVIYVDGTAVKAGAALKSAEIAIGEKQTIYLNAGYGIATSVEAPAVVIPALNDYVLVVNQAASAWVDPNAPEADEPAWGADPEAEEEEEEVDVFETQVVYMDGTYGIIKVAEGGHTAGKVYKLGETDGVKTLTAAAELGEVGTDTVTTGCFVVEGAFESDKKSNEVTEGKIYTTAATKVLTLETKTIAGTAGVFVKGTKVEAVDADDAKMNNTILVYTYNKTAKVRELALVIVEGAVAEVSEDLYYVNSTVLGKVYDATAKKTYKQVAIFELATGEKTIVNVAEDYTVVGGVSTVTVNEKTGLYTFTASAAETEVAAEKKAITVYNDLLSATGLVDLEVSAAKVVDVTGNGIDTVAKLVAKSAADKAIKFQYTVDEEAAAEYIVVVEVK